MRLIKGTAALPVIHVVGKGDVYLPPGCLTALMLCKMLRTNMRQFGEKAHQCVPSFSSCLAIADGPSGVADLFITATIKAVCSVNLWMPLDFTLPAHSVTADQQQAVCTP